jgi:hypothetical protein
VWPRSPLLRRHKLAARVVELKTQIKIHLPSSAPEQAIFGMLLDRLPRLVTRKPGRDAPIRHPVLQPSAPTLSRQPTPPLRDR